MFRLELTKSEKQNSYADYYYRASAEIPDAVLENIQHKTYTHQQALPFENINDLLLPGYLPMENGYCRMPDGSFFVAVRTEFPNATDRMFDWWYEWHAKESFRYRIWYPECHFDLSVKAAESSDSNQPLIGTQHIILLKMLDWARKNYPFTLFRRQILVLMYHVFVKPIS